MSITLEQRVQEIEDFQRTIESFCQSTDWGDQLARRATDLEGESRQQPKTTEFQRLLVYVIFGGIVGTGIGMLVKLIFS